MPPDLLVSFKRLKHAHRAVGLIDRCGSTSGAPSHHLLSLSCSPAYRNIRLKLRGAIGEGPHMSFRLWRNRTQGGEPERPGPVRSAWTPGAPGTCCRRVRERRSRFNAGKRWMEHDTCLPSPPTSKGSMRTQSARIVRLARVTAGLPKLDEPILWSYLRSGHSSISRGTVRRDFPADRARPSAAGQHDGSRCARSHVARLRRLEWDARRRAALPRVSRELRVDDRFRPTRLSVSWTELLTWRDRRSTR